MRTEKLTAMLNSVAATASGRKTFQTLSGFQVVISAMNVSEENLFTFSSNSKLCLHFRSEDCNAIAFTCDAYRLEKGEWVFAGKHTFNQQGNSRTIAVDWNEVVQVNHE